jgi:hypothetical protein
MRMNFGRWLATLAVLGVCSTAHAVTMQLTGVTGPSMGNVYTSPYTGLVGAPGESTNQLATNGVATTIICDDFLTDVSVGQFWQATATNLSSLTGLTSPDLTLKFGTTGSAAAQQSAYMTLGFLAEQLVAVNQSTSAGATQAGELSFAIWAVYDPAALNSISGADLAGAQADLTEAQAAILLPGHNSPKDYANVTVYTAAPTGASQEFLVVDPASVPEPGIAALLAVGFLGLIVLAARRRRQRLI